MKKALSFILCLALLLSSVAIMASAKPEEDVPLIIVPGFLQSYMFIEGEGDAEDHYYWLPHKEDIIQRIVDDMPNFLDSIAKLATKNDVENFGATLGGGAYAVAEKMTCNPDGSSIYPITHYKNDPAEANGENLKKIVDREADRKTILSEDFMDYIAENGYAELEDIFVFEYDSRLDAIAIASELRQYIKDVKAYTGASKVNIFTISYGGLITATYLYDYMDDGDIKKVVMDNPPLEGTNFPDLLFRNNVDFQLSTLIDFVESVLGSGTEIGAFLKNTDATFINRLFKGLSGGILGVVQYWSSIYSLTSPDLYDGLKRDFLDAEKSKPIIEANDRIHYEIMPKMSETFAKCQDKGISVSIITCTGSRLALGSDLNSDILVPAYSASGAVTASLGERFADGYTGVKTACDNPAHNHVSPSMEIDASSAFLPENTWFVDGSYHAIFEYEPYTLELATKLVYTDDLKDVYADKNFPQFENSNNPHKGITAKFDNSLSGYLSSKDNSVIVSNVYSSSSIIVTAVNVDGLDLKFKVPSMKVLKPGESIEIPFEGDIPEVSATRKDLDVTFLKIGSGLKTVAFPVTIMNGIAPAYAGGTVDENTVSALEIKLPTFIYRIISSLGLEKIMESLLKNLPEAL